MNKSNQHLHMACDEIPWDEYLDSLLPAGTEAVVDHHLVHCTVCRERIGELAASKVEWDQARQFLGVDQWDNTFPPEDGSASKHPEDSSGGSNKQHRTRTADPVTTAPSSVQDDSQTPTRPLAKNRSRTTQYSSSASIAQRSDAQDRSEPTGHSDDADVTIKAQLQQVQTWLQPTDDPHMLGRFAGYEIVGVIGFGGMGVVLKGYEPALSRYVAIKVLAPHLATSGAARQRFSREARAAAAVLHENVIAIHRVEEDQSLPFLVMPYIGGDSLQSRLDRHGTLPLATILRIGRQIAAGLAAAHEQGLIHRDIKPSNILLDKGIDRVTITDFGLARAVDEAGITRTGMVAGTPQYMSPEQATGEAMDHRSDLFSLGCVLYAMCVGRPPFRAETGYGVLRKVTDEPHRPIRELNPELPNWLENLVNMLLAKEANNRCRSARVVERLLRECLSHIQTPYSPVPAELTAHPPTPRRRVPAWFAVTGLLIGIVGAAGIAAMQSLGDGRDRVESRSTGATSEVATTPESTDLVPTSPTATESSPLPVLDPADTAWSDVELDRLPILLDEIDRLDQESEQPFAEPREVFFQELTDDESSLPQAPESQQESAADS